MRVFSDEELLDGLLADNDGALNYIYKNFHPAIKRFILKNSGSAEDADDIFQDAMVVIFRKVRDEGLQLDCSLKTFLYSVCRNLWLQKLEKSKGIGVTSEEIENHIELSDEMLFDFFDEENVKIKLIQDYFLELSPDCKKVLLMFFNGVSLKEIALQMGYKTEKYAKTRKFLCKENLKKKIKNDPQSKIFYK